MFDDYVGLPFKERGRDRLGLDCWGLLHLVYRERFGVVLPSFSEAYQTTEDGEHIRDLIQSNREALWREISAGTEEVGDGVLMTLRGFPRHVGIVSAPGLVLHIERASGSIIEPMTSPRLKTRIVGFFRYIPHEPSDRTETRP